MDFFTIVNSYFKTRLLQRDKNQLTFDEIKQFNEKALYILFPSKIFFRREKITLL